MRLRRNLFLADRDQILGAADHAGSGATDLHVGNGSGRDQLEHEVKGGNFKNADIGHAQHIRDIFNRGLGDPAFLLLGTPQQRNNRRGLTPLGVFGELRFGPHSVVLGFTAGAAVIIAVSQLKHVLGLSYASGETAIENINLLFSHLGALDINEVIIGLVTIATCVLVKKAAPKAPHMLLATLVAMGTAYLMNFSGNDVALVGEVGSAYLSLSSPFSGFGHLEPMLGGIIAVAMLGLVEAISIGRSVALKSRQQLDSNQEFIGQGLSNVVGSFFSCYVSSGSFTRSGVNYSSGAKTPLAAVFAGLILLIIMALFVQYAAYIPIAGMGGLLLVVAWNLVDFHHIRTLVEQDIKETVVLVMTFVAALVRFSTKLQEVIKKVVPPPTAKVRDALASAGSIAIPYLARPSVRRSIVKDHYCALALIKMATPDAYIRLKEYFKDNRASYIQKLSADIKKMDSEVTVESNLAEAIIADGIDKYDQRIRIMLSFLVQKEELIERGIHQDDLLGYERQWKLSQGLAPLNQLNEDEVIELDLSGSNYINFTALGKFNNLESINLAHVKNFDMSTLSDLAGLKKLNISSSDIKNFAKIVNLTNLEILILDCVDSNIESFEVLSSLNKLTTLKLRSTDLSNLDTSKLGKLVNLIELELFNTEISNIQFLENMPSLKKLGLCLNNIIDVSFLNKGFSLKELDLSYNSIFDISALNGLTTITKLDLSNNEIDDISALNGLSTITKLDLSNNEIDDISALNGLTKIKKLDLSNNEIDDISALNGLTTITKLNLSNNAIVDISALNGLTTITDLNLSNNAISDISILKNHTAITNLDISNNDIFSIEFLSSLESLRTLRLDGISIKSLNGLEKLDSLLFLSVSNIESIDFRPIVQLESLRRIHVDYSQKNYLKASDFKSWVYISYRFA